VHDLGARQMFGQRTTHGLCAGGSSTDSRRIINVWRSCRLDQFQFLKPQLKLFDLAGELLGRAPELHAPKTGDEDLELLDLQAFGDQASLGGSGFGLCCIERSGLRSDDGAQADKLIATLIIALITAFADCFDHGVEHTMPKLFKLLIMRRLSLALGCFDAFVQPARRG
jgi:hypothetical protein